MSGAVGKIIDPIGLFGGGGSSAPAPAAAPAEPAATKAATAELLRKDRLRSVGSAAGITRLGGSFSTAASKELLG